MKVLSISLDETRGQAFALVESGDNEYAVSFTEEGVACSCQDSCLRHAHDDWHRCKHADLVAVAMLESDKWIEGKALSFLKTGLNFLDESFGGIPQGILMGLVGEPESGKSTLLFQLLFDIVFKTKGNAVIIDGEGGFFKFVSEHWASVFNAKYGSDVGLDLWTLDYEKWEKAKDQGNTSFAHLVDSKKESKIHIIDLIGTDGIEPVFKLNLLVGKPSILSLSPKGKPDLRAHPSQDKFYNIKNSALGKFVADNGITALGLDSLTMVIETKYAAERDSFPARAKNNMQVCFQLQTLTSTFNLYTIVLHHLTSDPAGGRFAPDAMTGGKGTRHNFKVQGLISIYGNAHPSKRWFRILRSQVKPKGQAKWKFEITSDGIVDLEDVEE